jgi:DNA invertase Pin-like site-specific DNA recombinase
MHPVRKKYIINTSQRQYLVFDFDINRSEIKQLIQFMTDNRMIRPTDAIIVEEISRLFSPPEDYIDVSYLYTLWQSVENKRETLATLCYRKTTT